jgi:hypothetical protein
VHNNASGLVSDRWWTLDELNDERPDDDHPTTVDNLYAIYDTDELARCWRKELVPVAAVDPIQLADDPHDVAGEAKIASLQRAVEAGDDLPAVVVVHHPDLAHPYSLMEGRHRYNAAHRAVTDVIFAWVGHLDCCGSPYEGQ